MLTLLKALSAIVIVIVFILGLIFLIPFLWSIGPEKWGCEALSRQTGIEVSYDKWNTCMLKMPNGEFITQDAYQEVMKKKLEITINNNG